MSALTLILDDRHTAVLESMSAEQGLSKAALLRQAIRLYQVIHERAKKGEQMAFVKDGEVVPFHTLSTLPIEQHGETA